MHMMIYPSYVPASCLPRFNAILHDVRIYDFDRSCWKSMQRSETPIKTQLWWQKNDIINQILEYSTRAISESSRRNIAFPEEIF